MGRKSNIQQSKEIEAIQDPVATENPAEEENTQDGNVDEWLMEKLAPYFKVYPNEKLFYITSDGQVFLEGSQNDAANHQRRMDKTKEVITFEVE